jgi:prevent-host-death family protein
MEDGMQVSTKQLRVQPGKIISMVNNGQDVTVTYRGKPSVKIIPIRRTANVNDLKSEDELFGLWENRDIGNIDEYVRNMRKGRNFDN